MLEHLADQESAVTLPTFPLDDFDVEQAGPGFSVESAKGNHVPGRADGQQAVVALG